MTPRIAGHLLVECLIAQGVTKVFGVPGESYLAVLDGFHRHTDQIQFIINRQEGAPPLWPRRTANSPAGRVCAL